jgi:hypothetical protein
VQSQDLTLFLSGRGSAEAALFENDLARVLTWDFKYAYLDKTGRMVWKSKKTYIQEIKQ